MKTIINVLVIGVIAVIFQACANNPKYDTNRDYGFSGNPFHLPPLEPHKTRILVYRPQFRGIAITYNMSIDYNPAFIADDEIDKNTPKTFLGLSQGLSAFYADVPSSSKPVIIHAATEAQYNLPLVLKPNTNYCLHSGVKFGVLIGRPYFVPVEQAECEKYFPKYFKYFDNHAEYIESWLQDKAKFEEKQKAREQKAKQKF